MTINELKVGDIVTVPGRPGGIRALVTNIHKWSGEICLLYSDGSTGKIGGYLHVKKIGTALTMLCDLLDTLKHKEVEE